MPELPSKSQLAVAASVAEWGERTFRGMSDAKALCDVLVAGEQLVAEQERRLTVVKSEVEKYEIDTRKEITDRVMAEANRQASEILAKANDKARDIVDGAIGRRTEVDTQTEVARATLAKIQNDIAEAKRMAKRVAEG